MRKLYSNSRLIRSHMLCEAQELSRFAHIIETRAVQKIISFCSHSIIVLVFGCYFDL
jgi:hypothetical protein